MPLGVTVVTPSYAALAAEAIARFRAATGCAAVLTIDVPEDQGFLAKMHLDELCAQRPIIFFDADWWALREIDVEQVMVSGAGFRAVHDPAAFGAESWPGKDCLTAGIPQLEYFNTGFFACDLSQHQTRQVFAHARDLRDAGRVQLADPTDQGWINLARHSLGQFVSLMPQRFNYYHLSAVWGYYPHTPRGIVGLHAAGYSGADKMGALLQQAEIFGTDFRPMAPDAMAAHHQATFENR